MKEDHAKMYAHHIAQAIRHKKEMLSDGGFVGAEEQEESVDEHNEEFLDPSAEAAEEQPLDDKAKRRARLKAILSR